MAKVLEVLGAPQGHWVGDGFPVRSMFTYSSLGRNASPFLLLDYVGPMAFKPADHPRGVGQHPHRGFETVTIVYQGELEHRDSTGSGGIIGAGDVQWMTAGAGILHEEFHSTGFARTGGTLEAAQLWVNLPARDKSAPPGYQSLVKDEIPEVALPGDAGVVRVIAGEFAGRRGPARVFTPLNVWDMRLRGGGTASFEAAPGHTVAIVVFRGTVQVGGQHIAREAQMVLFDREGGTITLEANGDALLLVLTGEPIEEPIVGYGPFVMNTSEEIHQAIRDFNSGRFGQMQERAG